MLTIIVEHKYCQCCRQLQGDNIEKIFKQNNLDNNIWKVIDIERN